MKNNLELASKEIQEATNEVFNSSVGSSGYHLCYALQHIIDEIKDIKKELNAKT